MANVRVVSFAGEGIPCANARFTFFYRLNTGKTWLARGLHNTTGLNEIINADLDAVCTSPTRTLLRTDDGSGAEMTLKDMIRFIEQETTLGQGKLGSIYVVAYPTNPISNNTPPLLATENLEGGHHLAKKTSCCALQ
jgi:hypothetical protein